MQAVELKQPSFWYALRSRSRVTIALMIKQIKRHGGGARLSLPLSALDMSGRIVVLALIISIIGRRPAYGDSVILFLVTGILPYIMFVRSTSAVTRTEMAGSRDVSPLTTTASHTLANVVSTLVVAILAATAILSALHFTGVRYAIPVQPWYLAAALGLLSLLAFGFGMFNAIIASFFPPWPSIWRMIVRGMFLLSGIFYVLDFLPYQMRSIIEWNPLAHAVILSRLAFYTNYPTLVLDVQYLAHWCLVLVFLGLILNRVFRRRFR